MEDFYVDEKKRKNTLKAERKRLKGTAKVLLWLKNLLIILSIFSIVGAMLFSIVRGVTDVFEIVIFGLVGSILAGIFFVIIVLLHVYVNNKYLKKWIAYVGEEIHMTPKELHYGTYIKFCGEGYRTWHIKYADIKCMEYDKEKGIFRIEGECIRKVWADASCSVCTYDFEKSMEDIRFLDYFQDFQKLTKLLEERTGKRIIYKKIAV